MDTRLKSMGMADLRFEESIVVMLLQHVLDIFMPPRLWRAPSYLPFLQLRLRWCLYSVLDER